MTEKEYKEKIKKLEEINEEMFLMIIEMNKHIRELENMMKVKRIEKL